MITYHIPRDPNEVCYSTIRQYSQPDRRAIRKHKNIKKLNCARDIGMLQKFGKVFAKDRTELVWEGWVEKK